MDVITNAEIESETPLFLRMTIDGEAIDLNGVVIYTDPRHGVDIHFQAMSEKNEEIFKRELHLE